MQRIEIVLWFDQSNDWSLEVNGVRHEHVTSQLVEDLVECALVVADNVLAEDEPPGTARAPRASVRLN